MMYAVCCVPVSPIRKEPSHAAEMTSQLLFGERCMVTEELKDGWCKIKCRLDDYEGYCQAGQLGPVEEETYNWKNIGLTADWASPLNYNGYLMHVPFGSSLTAMNYMQGYAKKKQMVDFKGDVWDPTEAKRDARTIRKIAFTYFNTAYVWGGRSVFGTDCSGFTQMVYKFLDVVLPRDAAHQSAIGEEVDFLQQARCGDLAFFDDGEGHIIHTGILLNDFEIIHAAGKVRVDKVDNHGIVNAETGERTHHLRIIKRVV